MKKIILILILANCLGILNVKAQGSLNFTTDFIPEEFVSNLNHTFFMFGLNYSSQPIPVGSVIYFEIMIGTKLLNQGMFVTQEVYPQFRSIPPMNSFFVLEAEEVNLLKTNDSLVLQGRIYYDGDTDTTYLRKAIPVVEPPADLDFELFGQRMYSGGQEIGDTMLIGQQIDSIPFKVKSNYPGIPGLFITNRVAVYVDNVAQINHTFRRRFISANSNDPVGYLFSRLNELTGEWGTGLLSQLNMPSVEGWVDICVELDEIADANPLNNSECGEVHTRVYMWDGVSGLEDVSNMQNKFRTWHSNNLLHLEFENEVRNAVQVEIYDIQGKRLDLFQVNTSYTTKSINLSQGIYLVNVLHENGNRTASKLLVN
jgi:hypothetical protein